MQLVFRSLFPDMIAASTVKRSAHRGKLNAKQNASSQEESEHRTAAPRIVGVIGAKGGAGASTIALSLASCMSRSDETTIIDANLYQPDISFMLAAKDMPRDIRDLFAAGRDVDATLLQACRKNFKDQLHLITGPSSGEASLEYKEGALRQLLESCSTVPGNWIVDLPKRLDAELITMIDRCKVIVLVTDCTAVSFNSARRWLAVLNDVGHRSVILAVNRVDKNAQVAGASAVELTGALYTVTVPAAFKLLQDGVVAGQPAFTPNCKDAFSKAVGELASVVCKLS